MVRLDARSRLCSPPGTARCDQCTRTPRYVQIGRVCVEVGAADALPGARHQCPPDGLRRPGLRGCVTVDTDGNVRSAHRRLSYILRCGVFSGETRGRPTISSALRPPSSVSSVQPSVTDKWPITVCICPLCAVSPNDVVSQDRLELVNVDLPVELSSDRVGIA